MSSADTNATSSSLAAVVENICDVTLVCATAWSPDAMTSIASPMDGVLDTVTWTPADLVVFPAASRATASSRWLLFEAPVVFQTIEYGLAVSAVPRLAPSSRNCTPRTPTLSLAFAETVTLVPETVLPSAGAVIADVGGVVSGGGATTVTVMPTDGTSRLPLVSVARLFTVVVPAEPGVH